MLQLSLVTLPDTTLGIYKVAGVADRLAPRMRRLHPAAAGAFDSALVYSDIFRSADESLQAMRTKAGVQRPAYSAHNFGLAVDVAVDATLARMQYDYPALLAHMQAAGWYCHRRDAKRGFEDWHFNYLGAAGLPSTVRAAQPKTWALAAEAAIQARYGQQLRLSVSELQQALKTMRMYAGEVDGVAGPLTRNACAVFGRAWDLPAIEHRPDSVMLQRTLAYVTAS